ncbi:MAG: NAD(P)/FAD-dependent oxidoreductase [Polyangiales bacterium]
MSQDTATDFPIAIIGAGFAGIGAAIRLKQEGIESFTMFERADEVGGTWRDNTYPGCACDVQSRVYSFSFEQNPNWTRRYSGWREIQEYLIGLVDKWSLDAHLRRGTEIVRAVFDEAAGTWTLTTREGATFTARVVISGVGGLVDPAYPDIEGMDQFEGEMFHTARWRHDVDLDGKRVAIVGTGASAVQVVPSIAPDVGQLSVFQRSAAWVIPKYDKPYSLTTRRFLSRFPRLLRLIRFVKYVLTELLGPIVFLDSKILSRIGRGLSMWNLRRQVQDPVLREKLTPDFQFGCKRVLVSDDYWAAFERDNVDLVTEPIDRIVPEGIEAGGTLRPFDIIVLATGYLLGLARTPFEIIGRRGRTLAEVWDDRPTAYKGMTVSGFPNWFMMMGPNTGPGHTSVLIYTEAQIDHALQAIKRMRAEGIRFCDVRQEAQDEYNAGIQGRMKYMVWGSGCQSWYLSDDGRNYSLYPGFAAEYVWRARKLKAEDYELAYFEEARDNETGEPRSQAQHASPAP